jgi:hypothetical protein
MGISNRRHLDELLPRIVAEETRILQFSSKRQIKLSIWLRQRGVTVTGSLKNNGFFTPRTAAVFGWR